MKSDAFIGAVYAGVLAAIVSSVVQLGPILIGVQTISIVVVAAGIFLPIGQIFTPLGIILGIIGHLIIGAIWGIVLYAIFYIFGLDKSVQKGLLLGIFIWFFGTEMMRWNTTNYIIWGDIEQVWKLIHDMIFGTLLGYLVPQLAMQGASKAYPSGLLERNLIQPAYKPTPESDGNKNDT